MSFRAFTTAVFGIACALSVTGCGSILIRPAADTVRTVALVSACMNRDFYDVKAPRAGARLENLASLGKAVAGGTAIPGEIDDPLAGQYEDLLACGIKAYSDRLEGVGGWQWLPRESVLSNAAYREFAGARAARSGPGLLQAAAALQEAQWYTARNMVRIPLESVLRNGTAVSIGGMKDPQADMRRALAKLCKDLGVDAVAVLEFDMAYKKPLVGLDLFGDLPGVPSVSAALVLVNKDGEIAVNSGLIVKGQGRRFEGKTVGMLQRDSVRLYDKSIDSYCQAIDKSAEDMKQRLAAAFGRIK